MRESQTRSELPAVPQESAWRDTALVIGVAALSFMLSIHFNLNARTWRQTRHGGAS